MQEKIIFCRFENEHHPHALNMRSILVEKSNNFTADLTVDQFNSKVLRSAKRCLRKNIGIA